MVNIGVRRFLSDLGKMKWNLAYKGIIVGIIAGMLVSLYRMGVEYGAQKAVEIYSYMSMHPRFILPWIVVAVVASFVVYSLMKWEPQAMGSGIPAVGGLVLFGLKIKWYTVIIVRFAAGILTSFFGVSMGRSGPSVQIGAAGAQAFAKVVSKNKYEKNYLITAGAAAGLAATFNTPLSGIMITLEEVHRSFSPHILLAVTSAAVVADLISKLVFGLSPILSFFEIPQLPVLYHLWLPVIGIVSGIVGGLANQSFLKVEAIFDKIPEIFRPMIVLFIALPCGLFIPEVIGGGQNLIKLSEGMEKGIVTLLIFFIVKLLFTAIGFGSGIPGGIFMPLLSIGALAGAILGQIAMKVGVPQEYVIVFCICSMAGVMASSIKAPITSIILIAEITGFQVHILPVAMTVLFASFTAELLHVSSIYEVLLARKSTGQNQIINRRNPGAIVEIPVEVGSIAASKKICEIIWPEGMLIVTLRRGETEIVPNGDTKILPGDYILAVTSVQKYEELHLSLREFCHAKQD